LEPANHPVVAAASSRRACRETTHCGSNRIATAEC
jgi:hypothetical protein